MEQHAKRHLAADAAAGHAKTEPPPLPPAAQLRPPLPASMGSVRPAMPLPMNQCAALAAAMMAQGTFSGGMDMNLLSKHLQSVIAANLGMPLLPASMPPLLPIPEVVPRCHFAAEACPRLACAFKSVEHFHCGLCDQGCLDSLLLASHVAEAHPGAILAPPLLPPPVMLKRAAAAGSQLAAQPPASKRLTADGQWSEEEDAPGDEEEEEVQGKKEEREDGGSSSAPRSAAEEEEEEEEGGGRFLDHGDVHGFEFFPADADCHSAECEFARRCAHFHCARCPYICADRKKSLAHAYRHLDP